MNTPKKLDKYVIDSLIGQGTMGSVYKAFDQDIDRVVAIKILHSHLQSDNSYLDLKQRFSNEIKAAARCFHQNIVTVFDCGFSDGAPYMVMEYVKGLNLRAVLSSCASISAEQSIEIIHKVLAALHFAHQEGVVHRDIKPANIMLLDSGQVKVTDFGIAHIDTSDLTQIGDVIGTISYMAPEARAGKKVDGRSDIFAVALVLLELLTKKRLQPHQLTETELVNLLSYFISNQQQSKQLAAILIQALHESPDRRYQLANDFSKALADCYQTTKKYHQVEDGLAQSVIHIKSLITPNQTKNHTRPNSNSIKTSPSSVHAGQLSILEKSLSNYLGPIAKILVKKHSKTTENVDQLMNSLATQIPSEPERQKFIKSLTSSGIHRFNQTKSNSQASQTNHRPHTAFTITLSTEEITQLTNELAKYLGPMAKFNVALTLNKATSLDDLYFLLGQKIPEEIPKKNFFKQCTIFNNTKFLHN